MPASLLLLLAAPLPDRACTSHVPHIQLTCLRVRATHPNFGQPSPQWLILRTDSPWYCCQRLSFAVFSLFHFLSQLADDSSLSLSLPIRAFQAYSSTSFSLALTVPSYFLTTDTLNRLRMAGCVCLPTHYNRHQLDKGVQLRVFGYSVVKL